MRSLFVVEKMHKKINSPLWIARSFGGYCVSKSDIQNSAIPLK